MDKLGYRLVHKENAQKNEFRKHLKAFQIEGFFSEEDCYQLYQLALVTEGPILEIGHFLGRSTACICEALQDSGVQREFISYDLGFKTQEEFKSFYDQVHRRDTTTPREYIELVYNQNKTSTEVARINLDRLGLGRYVDLVSGDFTVLDKRQYNFIFCDAMHDGYEVDRNLPHVIARSRPRCVWAFHDMNRENIQRVLDRSNAIYVDCVESFGIFIFRPQPG